MVKPKKTNIDDKEAYQRRLLKRRIAQQKRRKLIKETESDEQRQRRKEQRKAWNKAAYETQRNNALRLQKMNEEEKVKSKKKLQEKQDQLDQALAMTRKVADAMSMLALKYQWISRLHKEQDSQVKKAYEQHLELGKKYHDIKNGGEHFEWPKFVIDGFKSEDQVHAFVKHDRDDCEQTVSTLLSELRTAKLI